MDLASLVFDHGDPVRAQARLAARDGRYWVSPWPVEHYAPGSDPGPYQLPVEAANVAAEHPALRAPGGVVLAGWAELTGTRRSGRFILRDFHAVAPPTPTCLSQNWTVTPCPPPAGAWPQKRPNWWDWPPGFAGQRAFTALARAGLITARGRFRPGGTGYAFVAAATEVERVEAALLPHFGPALGVIPSRFTAGQYDAAREALIRHCDVEDTALSLGSSDRPDGQRHLTALLSRVTPAFAELVDDLPHGMLDLEVMFTPLSRAA